MSPARTIPWIAFGGGFLFVVLLYFAPRIPDSVQGGVNAVTESDRKIQEAVTLVEGTNPMQGIRMLREVLADEPENLEAIWHLGVFSVRSNQLDLAEGRFEELIRLDKEGAFIHAHFYLGNIYDGQGRTEEAIREYESYRSVVEDTTIVRQLDMVISNLRTDSETN